MNGPVAPEPGPVSPAGPTGHEPSTTVLPSDPPLDSPRKLCLVMIVKDEAPVIERCLRSCLPIIDSWSIVDTGSTDGTQEIIQGVLSHLPGKLHERPWKNFAHNRTEAIELAVGLAAYDLVMDADDVLQIPEGFELPPLTLPVYNLTVLYAPIAYPRPHIFRNDAGFKYTSVVHEYLDVPYSTDFIHGIYYKVIGGGNRSLDSVGKYERDAKMLIEALEKEPSNPRYIFYLAQSYKDIGTEIIAKSFRDNAGVVSAADKKRAFTAWRKSLATYERRAGMENTFYQEVFVSLLECGKMRERLEENEGSVQAAYLRCYDKSEGSGRLIEPLYELARYYRAKFRWPRAYLFGCSGHDTNPPSNALFTDASVYAWRYDFERATSAFYVGRKEESKGLYEKLLDIAPPDQKSTLEANLKFFQ